MKLAFLVAKLVPLVIGAIFASSATADSGMWIPESILHDATSGSDQGYFNVGNIRYQFSTIPGIATAYFNANFDTNPTPLAAQLKAGGMFGLSSTSILTPVTTDFTIASNGFTIAAPTTIAQTFDLLGVHVGGGELVFGWTPSNSSEFTISTNGYLSNYTSFQSDGLVIQSSIPEPRTYVMMLAGLLAVGYMVRRRNTDRSETGGNASFAM